MQINIPVHKAIALLILSSFATSVWQSYHGGQFTPSVKRFWPLLAGIAAGLVGGLSMLFGPVYAMYLAGLKLGKESFVAAISLANVWATVVLAIAMAQFDLLGGADLAASLLALVPASAGVVLGTWLRRHINEETFLKMPAVVLFLIGLNLIRRAVF